MALNPCVSITCTPGDHHTRSIEQQGTQVMGQFSAQPILPPLSHPRKNAYLKIKSAISMMKGVTLNEPYFSKYSICKAQYITSKF